LSVTQGVQAFHSFLPNFVDIRRNNPNDDPVFAGDVRMGELAAATTTIGIGLIASSLTGSPVPTYTAILMSFILVALYEYTLRSHRPMEKPRGAPVVLRPVDTEAS
jgi:hypothetical protein